MTTAFPESAMCGFFDDHVTVEAVRTGGLVLRGTFAACVMPAELADPFAESSATSNVYKRTVLIAKSGTDGWNLAVDPQIGDAVTIHGKNWKIASVNPHTDEFFSLEVRSC